MELKGRLTVPPGHILVRQFWDGSVFDPGYSYETFRSGDTYEADGVSPRIKDTFLAEGKSMTVLTGGGSHWVLTNLDGTPRRRRTEDEHRDIVVIRRYLIAGFFLTLPLTILMSQSNRASLPAWQWFTLLLIAQAVTSIMGAIVLGGMVVVGRGFWRWLRDIHDSRVLDRRTSA